MKINPPYKPITQKPYCCVPVSISMILDRRGIEHDSQEEIGYQLGLIVPKEKENLFERVRTGEKPEAGYGTQIHKEGYSFENYFSKNNIPLKTSYYPPNEVENPKKFIKDNLKKNSDLLIFFNYGKLYGEGDHGHVSLIQEINRDEITFVDPGIDKPKIREVDLDELLKAMEYHREYSGGFWAFSKKD